MDPTPPQQVDGSNMSDTHQLWAEIEAMAPPPRKKRPESTPRERQPLRKALTERSAATPQRLALGIPPGKRLGYLTRGRQVPKFLRRATPRSSRAVPTPSQELPAQDTAASRSTPHPDVGEPTFSNPSTCQPPEKPSNPSLTVPTVRAAHVSLGSDEHATVLQASTWSRRERTLTLRDVREAWADDGGIAQRGSDDLAHHLHEIRAAMPWCASCGMRQVVEGEDEAIADAWAEETASARIRGDLVAIEQREGGDLAGLLDEIRTAMQIRATIDSLTDDDLVSPGRDDSGATAGAGAGGSAQRLKGTDQP